jgi:MFS family permease
MHYGADISLAVVIVGLSLGLFGYDNAFAAPLVSLPLFVEKYQGPSSDGTLVFTVCTSVHDMYNIANFEHARNLDLTITVPLVGAALGAFGATFVQKRLGRKMSFLLAYGTCSIPGSILQLFAPNLGALVVGRFWNCQSAHLVF